MLFAKYDPVSPPPLPAAVRGALAGAVAAVAICRLWRLPEAGLPDYDSVRNWQVVGELAAGDFAHLFHHGSPGFLLFFAAVARVLGPGYFGLQLVNAGLALGGLAWFGAWVTAEARLRPGPAAAVVLLGGTGLLLTFSGRDFTMNSLGLLLGTGLLQSYFRRLHAPPAAAGGALLRAVGWLAAGLCCNYKFLFAVPILALLEWHRADGLLRRPGLALRALAVLALPYLLLGAAGVAVGLPWYRWLGFYFRTVWPAASNPAGRHATLHFDWEFYFRYLTDFELPLLLPALVAVAVAAIRAGYWRRGQPLPLAAFLAAWAGCLLLGMSLLLKAPRGLLLAYLPLAALLVLAAAAWLPHRAAGALLLASLGLNLYRLHTQLYAYLPSGYPAVAAWLRAHPAGDVAATGSLGLAPYLPEGQPLTVVLSAQKPFSITQNGIRYLLLDDYARVANLPGFDSLRRQLPLAAWPARPLLAPLLYLEHAEYTGLGYAQTLRRAAAAATDTAQLRLYYWR